jgi:hypothetical protein
MIKHGRCRDYPDVKESHPNIGNIVRQCIGINRQCLDNDKHEKSPGEWNPGASMLL